MPAFTTFVLNDGVADHTFSPLSVSLDKSVLVAREGTTSAGNPTAILGLRPANGGSGPNKVSVRLNQPMEDDVDGVTTVNDTFRFNADVIIPDGRTVGEREKFAALVGAILAHALVEGYIADLDPLYG